MEEIEQEQAALDSTTPDSGTPERAHSGPLAPSLSGSLGSRPVIAGLLDRMRSLRWSDTPPGSPQIQSHSQLSTLSQAHSQPSPLSQPGRADSTQQGQQDSFSGLGKQPEGSSLRPPGDAMGPPGQAQELLEAEQELAELESAEAAAAAGSPGSQGKAVDSKPVRAQKAKLGQLQRLAKFAQSAKGGVRSRVWPSFHHFGR